MNVSELQLPTLCTHLSFLREAKCNVQESKVNCFVTMSTDNILLA